MRIFWTFCVYNERELLPFKIDYMRRNGIGFYVFDNMSTDGSWEWLRKNGVPSERFDSGGMFDLRLNLALLKKKIHEVKPDWAMMGGADFFYVHLNKTLPEVIEGADKKGFNLIRDSFQFFHFMFTGEERPGNDPRLTYMYYLVKPFHAVCIAKYDKSLVFYNADIFKVPNPKIYEDGDFATLHYSMRHDCKERKTEEYLRRKKAWDCGHVDKGHGSHYRAIIEKGQFVFDKNSLRDIRESKFWGPIKRSVGAD